MPANDYYFCYDPSQEVSEDEDTGCYILISDKSYYDEERACSDWELTEELEDLIPHFHAYWEEATEGSFVFVGELAAAVGILRAAGFVEKQDLLVPFGRPAYASLSPETCVNAAEAFLQSIPSEDENGVTAIEGEDVAAALRDAIESEDEDVPERNPFSAQAGITPEMTTADILAVARQRMADQRREYEEKQNSEPVNVEITKVSRYDSDWDKSVIFKGFNFRVVLRDEDSIIRRMNVLREVENKLATFLNENDYIVQTNDDTDEMEVYLKSTRSIIVWKMEESSFFSSRVERIEQHEG